MRRLVTTGVMALGTVLMWGATAAQAQDLTLGYELQRFSGNGDSFTAPLGFDAEVSVPITPMVAVVGGVDWTRHKESASALGVTADLTSNHLAFAGGLRWTPATTGTAKPLVQARFGVMHSSYSTSSNVSGLGDLSDSTNDPLFDIGAGAMFPLSGSVQGVAQVFYRRIFGDQGVNGLGFVLGVGIPLH